MNQRLILPLLLLATPLTRLAVAEQFIPAGSILQCTIDEKISSKTIAVGDPVLCQVSHTEAFGRSALPFGTYLEGRFAEFKDPGRLVGKGWVELKFDKLVLGQENVIPINARVIQVPKYPVDDQGRILGTGHSTRDIVEWSIPILWPIDLINLPRRGPRVVLKPETTVTLRVMDDLGLPQDINGEPQHRQPLIARDQTSQAAQPQYQQAPAPIVQAYAQQPQYTPQQQYAPQQTYAPQPSYQQPPPTVIYNNNYAAPQQYQRPPQQQQQTVVIQQQSAYRPRPVVPPPYPYAYYYGYPRYASPY